MTRVSMSMLKIKLCLFCTGAIPSPCHTEQCLRKPGEDWVAVANGERRAFQRMERCANKMREQVTFWQGKFAILNEENNVLRKKLRNT